MDFTLITRVYIVVNLYLFDLSKYGVTSSQETQSGHKHKSSTYQMISVQRYSIRPMVP